MRNERVEQRSERAPLTFDVGVRQDIFTHIESGAKTVEVRTGGGFFDRVQTGDSFKFKPNGSANARGVTREVLGVDRYGNFEELLAAVKPEAIYPHMTQEQLIAGLRRIYSPDQERRGVLAFELGLSDHK